MPKRATRLGAEIIGILRQMLDGGVTDMHLAALVKMVWTIGLSEELLTELVQSLSRRMNAWRAHATGESARDMSAASLDSCMAIGMPGLV